MVINVLFFFFPQRVWREMEDASVLCQTLLLSHAHFPVWGRRHGKGIHLCWWDDDPGRAESQNPPVPVCTRALPDGRLPVWSTGIYRCHTWTFRNTAHFHVLMGQHETPVQLDTKFPGRDTLRKCFRKTGVIKVRWEW